MTGRKINIKELNVPFPTEGTQAVILYSLIVQLFNATQALNPSGEFMESPDFKLAEGTGLGDGDIYKDKQKIIEFP